MSQPTLFDGRTISEDPTAPERLRGLMERVIELVRWGQWWTLADLAEAAGGSEASVSARLRDLRKPRWGSHTVERRLKSPGVFQYRCVWNES